MTSRPEEIDLHLPSAIPMLHRETVCSPGLDDIEDQLRYAQATEALSGLRHQLRTRIMASKLNCKEAASQRAYLRSRALQDQVEARIRQHQRCYNLARGALLELRGSGDWEKTLAVLKPEDVRGMSERAMTAEEREQDKLTRRMAGLADESIHEGLTTPVVAFDPRLALGEGRRTLSWIWYSVSERELQGDSKEVNTAGGFLCCALRGHDCYQHSLALRVEWCKTRARANRWREEILLLEEEMRRALESCLWRSRWWQSRAQVSAEWESYLAEGLAAYACEQSLAEKERAIQWSSQWSAVRERARHILATQLSGAETYDWLPELVVELKDDDEEEEEERDRDDAEDDDG
jgi:hypothetical protein